MISDEQRTQLIRAAVSAADFAYVPYSKYKVGAALLTADGLIHTGCNVENASYPVCICAERTALVKAVSAGHRNFDAIVVATHNGGSPCGMCRQMLYEFSPEMWVIVVDFGGKVHLNQPLSELLPYGFGPGNLSP